MHEIVVEYYGYSVSTVFGSEAKAVFHEYEDDDPLMINLRFLDYRYVRFCFHPLKDKFVMNSNWKDSSWTNLRSIRAGLESDQRLKREQVFGKNLIDIQQKSIPQLLVDEVCINLLEFNMC